jgi:hypothetical protein
MADTENSYNIGFNWVNLNTVSGINVGNSFYIQNTGLPQDIIVLAVSAIEPDADFKGVNLYQKEIKPIIKGNNTTWAKLVRIDRDPSKVRTASINIQESMPAIGDTSVVIAAKLPPVAGSWGYNSGVSGTITLSGGKRVLQITAVALETAGSFTINGGNTIALPYGNTDKVSTELTIQPQGNLTDPIIVFTGTDSYFVEYVT